jgi:hypothetical protein
MLSHNVVKDLLPGYVDGICSDETNAEIAEHLKDCHECESVYTAMKAPEPKDETPAAKKDLDYLKKIRKRNLRRVFIAAFSVLVCAALFVAVFVVGFTADSERVEVTNAEVAGENALLLIMEGSGSLSVRESITDEPCFRLITPNGPKLVDRTVVLDVNIVPELFGSGKTYTYNLEDSGMLDFSEVNEYRVIVRMADKEVIGIRDELEFNRIYMNDDSSMLNNDSAEFPPTPYSYSFSMHEVDTKNNNSNGE